MRLEIGKGDVGATEVTDQVGLNDLLMRLQWRVLEIADRADACVVDPYIDSPMAKLGSLRSQLLYLVAAADIGSDCHGVSTAISALVQHVE
ncbi:hypothetical protein D3C79_897850 [compost metagenome]